MQASGVILSGGRSSRMTFNKAFADICGRSVLEIIIKKFEKYFDELMIITNEPELYHGLVSAVYIDVYPRMGPMAGIHSGLYHSRYETIFLLGCDMPFINMELAAYMLENCAGYDCVVPVIDNKPQPLFAVYNTSCLSALVDCLENNKLKLTMFVESLNTRYMYENEMEYFGDISTMFFNVNDLAALKRAREMSGGLQDKR